MKEIEDLSILKHLFGVANSHIGLSFYCFINSSQFILLCLSLSYNIIVCLHGHIKSYDVLHLSNAVSAILFFDC